MAAIKSGKTFARLSHDVDPTTLTNCDWIPDDWASGRKRENTSYQFHWRIWMKSFPTGLIISIRQFGNWKWGRKTVDRQWCFFSVIGGWISEIRRYVNFHVGIFFFKTYFVLFFWSRWNYNKEVRICSIDMDDKQIRPSSEAKRHDERKFHFQPIDVARAGGFSIQKFGERRVSTVPFKRSVMHF